MQFEDKDNYLLKFLLPLAVFLYVITPVTGAVRLLQFALSAIVALLFYFMLWVGWPDMFPLWGTTMLILVLVVMLAMVGLAAEFLWLVELISLALVAIPAVQHNAGWIAVMFGAPPWAGYLFLGLFLVLLLVLLYYASVLPLVRTLVKCAFSSFFLMVMLRTVHFEEPTGLHHTQLACGDSSDTRCPYALDSWPFLALWVALFGVLLWVMWALRKQRLQRDKDALEARRKRNIERYNHLVDSDDDEHPKTSPFAYEDLTDPV